MLVNISRSWRAGPAAEAAGRNGSVTARATSSTRVAAAKPAHVLVRPATIADMRAIEPLIREFANDNLMLPKTFDQLVRGFREFVVATDEENRVLGCGSLRVYNEDLAEICSLAVDGSVQGMGIGRKLVQRLVDEARALSIGRVFALTLRPEFFSRLGFGIAPKEEFPLKVWTDCRNCPKLDACDEVAVAIDLEPPAGPSI